MSSNESASQVLVKAVDRARRKVAREAVAVETRVSGHESSFEVTSDHTSSFMV